MSINIIWSLAWPVILSNITIPLLGMVDIAMVGHGQNEDPLAAVAIGSLSFDILFWGFGFLRMTTTGLVAQHPTDSSHLYRSLISAAGLSLLLILLQQPLFHVIKLLMHVPVKSQLAFNQYFYTRIYASFATLVNFVILGYFFGRQQTKAPLFLLVFINCLAIGLDIVFVQYLNFGVKGLALANIIAQSVGAICGLWLLQRICQAFTSPQTPLFCSNALSRLFHLNKDIFIRTICLIVTMAYFTREGAHLGAQVVAANAILLSMHHFVSYGLDGFAIACEALVGNAISKKNKHTLIQTIILCAKYAFFTASLFSVSYLFLGNHLIQWMSSLNEVVIIAKQYLPWVILLPLFSVGGYLLDGVFIGATWSKPMRNTMLIASFMVFLPMALLLTPIWGNTGLWLSFSAFMLSRGLLLLFVLKKKLAHF